MRLYRPFIRWFNKFWYDTPYFYGDRNRLHIGDRVCLANTVFNMSSGDIHIGDATIFSHNVMVLTGRHQFVNGRRASLEKGSKFWGGGEEEVPPTGYDIHIGSGCWIAAGAMILGRVRIGDNCIIMAGAVVTKDVPDGSIVGGVPAQYIGKA